MRDSVFHQVAPQISFVSRQEHGGCTLDALLQKAGALHREIAAGEAVFVGGMQRRSLFLVRRGVFKLSLRSENGGERVVGLRMCGDVLGADGWSAGRYGCSAIGIEPGGVLEIPSNLIASNPRLRESLRELVTRELECCRAWDEAVSRASNRQRVAVLLLDLAARHHAAGLNPRVLPLRVYCEELANLLALPSGEMSQVLAGLVDERLISGDGFEIEILDLDGLLELAQPARAS